MQQLEIPRALLTLMMRRRLNVYSLSVSRLLSRAFYSTTEPYHTSDRVRKPFAARCALCVVTPHALIACHRLEIVHTDTSVKSTIQFARPGHLSYG